MKVLKQKDWVKSKLSKYPVLRDSTARLYYNFLKDNNYDTNKSIKEFLKDIEDKEIPYIDSIGRCSRKMQEEHPELQGNRYKLRMEEAKKVKKEIKDYDKF